MIFDAHVMSGVAGKGRGQENAIALAEFLNKTQPDRIVNFSLFLHNQVALYEDINPEHLFRQMKWKIWKKSVH